MTFKTLLAGSPKNNAELTLPALASPKLDGIRFHVISGEVVSRNLLPFKNEAIQAKYGKAKFNGLDGEFMCGDPTDPRAFRRAAVVNSYGGDISEVVAHVFDCFRKPDECFDDRLVRAERLVNGAPGFLMVSHQMVRTIAEVEKLEGKFLEEGYEGLMLRKINGIYKHGRSTVNEGYLLKLKRFLDGDALVVGAEERMHNANEKTLVRAGKAARSSHKAGLVGRGDLGALIVQDVKSGVQFNVGSGFTDKERSDIWSMHEAGELPGCYIKYQYFPTGGKDKPRFPTFLGFRDPGDM